MHPYNWEGFWTARLRTDDGCAISETEVPYKVVWSPQCIIAGALSGTYIFAVMATLGFLAFTAFLQVPWEVRMRNRL